MNVNGLECIYCGEAATARDHVIPHSLEHEKLPNGTRLGRTFGKDEVVPACYDCNTSLGNKALLTIAHRADWLSKRLKRKLDKLSKLQWTPEELADLGPTLRSYVIEKQGEKAIMLQRLKRCEAVAKLVDLTPAEYWVSDSRTIAQF